MGRGIGVGEEGYIPNGSHDRLGVQRRSGCVGDLGFGMPLFSEYDLFRMEFYPRQNEGGLVLLDICAEDSMADARWGSMG